jgi:hypothetical protein
MADLYNKVRKYLENNSKSWNDEQGNILLQNDGGDSYIKDWNVSGLVKPTDEQLTALDSDADILQSNDAVITTRKSLYGTTAEQLEYIVENGVDTFIAKQNQIKSDNPKS